MEKRKTISQDRRVLSLLRRARKPMTAYAILDRLRSEGVRSPPTVYRALEKLVASGHVHKLETLGAFMACSHGGGDGANGHLSAFSICVSCGHVKEIHDASLARAIRKAGCAFLSVMEREVLEISGLCKTCADKGAAHV